MNKKRNPGERGSEHIKIQRKLIIEEWMRDGLQRRDILKKAHEAGWDIADNTLDIYMGEIRDSQTEYLRAESKYHTTEHIVLRKKLFLRALAKNDVRTALACLDSEAKIEGILVEKGEVRHSGGIDTSETFNPDNYTPEKLIAIKKILEETKSNPKPDIGQVLENKDLEKGGKNE